MFNLTPQSLKNLYFCYHCESQIQNNPPFRNLISSATEAENITAGTGNSRSGTAILSENLESLVTHPEEEGYTEYELMNVTREALVGETKYLQEAADEI